MGWMTTVYVAVRQRKIDAVNWQRESAKKEIDDRLQIQDLAQRITHVEEAIREHRPLDERLADHETRIQLLERSVKSLERLPDLCNRILQAVEKN